MPDGSNLLIGLAPISATKTSSRRRPTASQLRTEYEEAVRAKDETQRVADAERQRVEGLYPPPPACLQFKNDKEQTVTLTALGAIRCLNAQSTWPDFQVAQRRIAAQRSWERRCSKIYGGDARMQAAINANSKAWGRLNRVSKRIEEAAVETIEDIALILRYCQDVCYDRNVINRLRDSVDALLSKSDATTTSSSSPNRVHQLRH